VEIIQNINPTIKLLIFDLDGTIINLTVGWDTLKEKLYKYVLENYNYDTNFTSLDKSLIDIKNKLGTEPHRQLIDIISAEEIKGIKLSNVKWEMVDFIKSQGDKKKAIFSSNTYRTIEYTLKMLEIFHLFECIISKEDVTYPKPSPEGLLKILNIYGLSPKEALFIGNTNLDEQAGKHAGIQTWLI
jgi:HAD superfamily hydrolase (TIGR01549 family)